MRLIDADELRKDIVERGTQLSGCYSAGIARYMDRMLAHVLAAFDNAPTIDAVPATIEGTLGYLHKVGWMQEHDRIMTEDVAPVRRGRWKHERLPSTSGGSYAVIRCSVCEYQYPMTETNYCPNCGAKMDEEENDGN